MRRVAEKVLCGALKEADAERAPSKLSFRTLGGHPVGILVVQGARVLHGSRGESKPKRESSEQRRTEACEAAVRQL